MAMIDVTADSLIRDLDLKPLPWEGGYLRETWRSDVSVPEEALGDKYTGLARRAHRSTIC